MNRYIKYGLWSLGAMLALVGAAVAYIALTFDPNSYKPQIIQAVKDSRQRNLQLEGDIRLRFFPSIGASLGKVSLSEFKSDREFVSIESASVSVKLLPLLSKQIVVDEVAVSGVRARVIKYRNGKTNLDDLLSKEAAPAVQAPAAETGAPMKFDIASVLLDKTELSYRDETSGAHYNVKDMSLRSGRIAGGMPTRVDFAAHIEANKPRLDIVAKVSTILTFDLEQNKFQVQALDLQANGTALDVADLAVKAGGDASAHPATQEFSLQRFALAVSGQQGKNRFDARLDAPDLSLTQDKFSGQRVALNAKLDGALGNFAAALMLPDVTGNARSFKVSSLALDMDIRQPEQAFMLKFSSPVTGSIEARQFNLSDLKLALNATGDKLPGKSINSELKGSVQADLGRQSIHANLAGGLLQSRIKAKLAVNNFRVPVIRYDLEVDRFDADPYLPQEASPDRKNEAAPEQPFDLSALQTLNLEGSLRVGALKAANVKVAQLRVDVKAKNGLVNIAPLSARLYKGRMEGKVRVDAVNNRFSVQERLSGIEIAPLMKDAADMELVEGKGNIALDLATQGNIVSGLKKALNGTVSVNLANGAIRGIDLAKLVQGVQSLGKNTTVQTLGVDKNEKTDFTEFKASFKVKNGVAHNDDLAVRSTVLRITGNGDVDIGRDSIDYNAQAIFAKTEQGRTATLPVKVYGPFDDLKFKVDYAALLKDVAKQKLDEKKEQLKEDAKAKAREELKKGLKNLFK